MLPCLQSPEFAAAAAMRPRPDGMAGSCWVENTAQTHDGHCVSYAFCGSAAVARSLWAPEAAATLAGGGHRLAELLLGFFGTAAQLANGAEASPSYLAACASAGGLRPLSSCRCFDFGRAQHFAIEDPLEPHRDLGGMVTSATLATLQGEIARARDLLVAALPTHGETSGSATAKAPDTRRRERTSTLDTLFEQRERQ